jgi:dTDP-4-amino-4,6-dideoxygalactose transaminase
LRVDSELLEAAHAAIASGWWSTGPRVAELEQAFARACGTREAVALANGTAALHLALLAVGCGPGDEVVLPSLTFVAAANVVLHTGAKPVFCDVIGEEDLNLDPADVEAAITARTKAVVIFHYAGYPCAAHEVGALAGERGLAVVEDAAHAPGARYRGQMCGALGDVGCFSFFSNKNLPVGEGGMAVTDDADLAKRLRLLRSHGMTTLTWDRHRGHASGYDVVEHGFNYRLDELRAAIALVQLDRLEDVNRARARLSGLYRERLAGKEGVTIPFGDADPDSTSANHLAVAVLPAGSDRDAVRARLAALRIQTSVHYPPIHRFSRFASLSARPLPRTEELAERIVSLPLFPHLEEEQVREVSDALLEALRKSVPVAD